MVNGKLSKDLKIARKSPDFSIRRPDFRNLSRQLAIKHDIIINERRLHGLNHHPLRGNGRFDRHV
jgi:hypothetical protein